MDAANVDLKAFTEDFYHQQTGSHLAPVLDTLQHIWHDTSCWLEITTLLIPGLNDSTPELDAMTRWIAEHLGADVPLHFTAFHPDYKMSDVPATPAGTLTRARRIARANGLRHVYTGNVHDMEGGTTFCPGCTAPLIERDWHAVLHYALDAQGGCPHCGTRIAGRFAPRFERGFGRRRIPVRVSAR
jgi:pyruvate formate lyase activating enzyme